MAAVGRPGRFAVRGASHTARRIARPGRITCRAPLSREDAGIRCLGRRRRCVAVDEGSEASARPKKYAESRQVCGRHLMENLAAKQECASAFDAHQPPSNEIIEKCVHCGFCLPVCPTYVLWGQEMDSPRGRIYLMKIASEGASEMNANWVSHFDSCLGCMACMTACASGVDYGKVIEATRAQIERKSDRGWLERLYRRIIFGIFTRPERLRLMRWPLLLYQKSGLRRLARGSGELQLLPPRLQAMEALLPELPATEAVAEVTLAVGEKRRRVGLLLGCVQREFFPEVNAATARVLAAEGCEVASPAEQSCCGALLVHAGEEEGAVALARHLINVFERAGVDAIVTNAAGCGSNVKEYGHLLRDDAQYEARAKEISAKCKEISEKME